MPYFYTNNINLFYIHIPKTGGTSIETYFYNKFKIQKGYKNAFGYKYPNIDYCAIFGNDDHTLQHISYQTIIKNSSLFNISFKNITFLATVRNPYHRIMSDMFFFVTKTNITIKSTPKEIENAIFYYLNNTNYDYDNHRKPQWEFLVDADGNIPNIIILKTETLTKQMHALGFTDFTLYENSNRTGVEIDYMSLFTEKSIHLVNEYYKEDFKRFGYSMIQIPPSPSLPPNINNITTNIITNKTTFVSAFVGGINKRNDRLIQHYMVYGKKLFSIPICKIIFIDRNNFNTFFKKNTIPVIFNDLIVFSSTEYPTTHFIPIDYNDIYLFKDHLKCNTKNFNVITNNPLKDTIEFIMVQCMKTEWVKEACRINIYESTQFIWVDFGAYHFIKNDIKFKEGLLHMANKSMSDNSIRIPCGKKPDFLHFSKNVYHHIIWLFTGSVFGGNIYAINKFADLVKDKCIDTLTTKKHLMWEINIWYLIFYENVTLFDRYIADHDENMFYNF